MALTSRSTVRTSGFRELERELGRIDKEVTRRNTAIRALEQGAQPMRATISGMAAVLDGDLANSVAVAARIGRGGRGKRTKGRRGGSGGEFGDRVEVFIGIDVNAAVIKGSHPLAYAEVTEFGPAVYDVNVPAQPFFRPGFEAEKHNSVQHIADSLTVEIGKAVGRQERKKARAAAR